MLLQQTVSLLPIAVEKVLCSEFQTQGKTSKLETNPLNEDTRADTMSMLQCYGQSVLLGLLHNASKR